MSRKRFVNLEPTRHAGFRDLVRWLLHREEGPWDEWREITPSVPPPRAAGLRVTWVTSATTDL